MGRKAILSEVDRRTDGNNEFVYNVERAQRGSRHQ